MTPTTTPRISGSLLLRGGPPIGVPVPYSGGPPGPPPGGGYPPGRGGPPGPGEPGGGPAGPPGPCPGGPGGCCHGPWPYGGWLLMSRNPSGWGGHDGSRRHDGLAPALPAPASGEPIGPPDHVDHAVDDLGEAEVLGSEHGGHSLALQSACIGRRNDATHDDGYVRQPRRGQFLEYGGHQLQMGAGQDR